MYKIFYYDLQFDKILYLHRNLLSSFPNAPSSGKEDAGLVKQNNARTAKTKRQVRNSLLFEPSSFKMRL